MNVVASSDPSPPFDLDCPQAQLPRDAPPAQFQFGLRKLFAAVLWIALACAVVVTFRRWLEPVPSAVYDPARWPQPLKEVVALAGERGIELGKVRVCRTDVEIGNEDYAWQTDASPALIEELIMRWKLVRLTSANRQVDGFWRVVPEEWRIRASAATAKTFWISQSWLNRDSCCRYVVLHEREQGKLYVWYHFIF